MFERHICSTKMSHKHQKTFGGYRTYWSLIAKMKDIVQKNGTLNHLGFFRKKIAQIDLMLVYFFAATIKPLKQFYSYETHIFGTIQVEKIGRSVMKNELKKTKTLKLFGLSLCKYSDKITKDEWNEILAGMFK